MRILPKTAHAGFDYAVSLTCISLPMFISCGPKTAKVLRTSGSWGVSYSALSDYPGGLAKRLAFPLHLHNETVVGAAMVLSSMTLLRGEPVSGRLAVGLKGATDLVGSVITRR